MVSTFDDQCPVDVSVVKETNPLLEFKPTEIKHREKIIFYFCSFLLEIKVVWFTRRKLY